MKATACNDLDKPFLFISYSSQDTDVVQRTLAELERNHFRFWYDDGIPSGDFFAETLAERIEQCSQMLLFLSKSAAASKYVLREIQFAIDQDKSILVIYLDDTKLDRKLKFLIGIIHAIRYDDPDFLNKLFRSISKEVLAESVGTTPRMSVDGPRSGAAQQMCEKTYRMSEIVGKGGMGVVYRAVHVRTGLEVIVKHSRKDATYRGSFIDGVFHTETKILASVRCPYIPTPLDCFEDDSDVYLVESLVPGHTLTQLLQGPGGFTETEAVEIGRKVLNVLRYFQSGSVQVVHKDLKPSNIMLSDRGDVYLIDFGSGQLTDFSQGWRNEVYAATPGYAAPEQYGGRVDWRTDQFGLGRTLARILTWQSGSGAVKQNYPIRWYNPALNPALERVLNVMTASSPDGRYASIDEADRALADCLTLSRADRLRLLAESDRALEQIGRVDPFARERENGSTAPFGTLFKSYGPSDPSTVSGLGGDSTERFTIRSDFSAAMPHAGLKDNAAGSWADGMTTPLRAVPSFSGAGLSQTPQPLGAIDWAESDSPPTVPDFLHAYRGSGGPIRSAGDEPDTMRIRDE